MNGRSVPDVPHLRSSCTFRILCQGDLGSDFLPKLRELWISDPARARKLERICARLEFVQQLQHSAHLEVTSWDEPRAEYQIDRLKAYLALTIIDVAAGKTVKEHEYHKWLRRAIQEPLLSGNILSAAEELAEAKSASDAARLLSHWTIELYAQDFRPRSGIGVNFRKFVVDAPKWLRHWLADVYIVLDGKEDPADSGSANWFHLDARERCERIADYLWKLRSNYTHTVEYRSPVEENHERCILQVSVKGAHYGFNSIHKDGDVDARIKAHVGLKNGIAESDVVSLIAVVGLRRDWLGIEDDAGLIQKYWKRVKYRRLGFAMLREIQSNMDMVSGLCRLLALSARSDPEHDYDLGLFKDKAAEEFVRLHKEFHPSQQLSVVSDGEYRNSIWQANLKLVGLHERLGQMKSQYEEQRQLVLSTIGEMVQLGDLKWLDWFGGEMARDLSRMLNQSDF